MAAHTMKPASGSWHLFGMGLLAVIIGIGLSVGIHYAQASIDYQRSIERYEAVVLEAQQDAESFNDSLTSYSSLLEHFETIAVTADAVLEIDGARYVNEDAFLHFEAARTSITNTHAVLLPQSSELHSARLNANQLPTPSHDLSDQHTVEKAISQLLARQYQHNISTAKYQRLGAELIRDAKHLHTAVESFSSNTAEHSKNILDNNPKATDASKAAFRTAVEALETNEFINIPDALNDYIAQAKALEQSAAEVIAEEQRLAALSQVPSAAAHYNINDPSALNVVVNKKRALPSSYVPGPLARPAVIPNPRGQLLRSDAANALTAMYQEMRSQGLNLIVVSGYRSYATQQATYASKVREYGQVTADTVSARAGHSEHQTGLAVDVNDSGAFLSNNFGNTASGRWIATNAQRYGFIIRYQAGQQHIVGYAYEPWHLRYIGATIATDMHNQGIKNLENYYGLPAAPGY